MYNYDNYKVAWGIAMEADDVRQNEQAHQIERERMKKLVRTPKGKVPHDSGCILILLAECCLPYNNMTQPGGTYAYMQCGTA